MSYPLDCVSCGDEIPDEGDAVAGPDGMICRDCARSWPAFHRR